MRSCQKSFLFSKGAHAPCSGGVTTVQVTCLQIRGPVCMTCVEKAPVLTDLALPFKPGGPIPPQLRGSASPRHSGLSLVIVFLFVLLFILLSFFYCHLCY